jgi:hypothetical protein|eukprot:SAG25_NODE_1171_length_3701_cov_2.201277_2_plen_71_part_00
MVLTIRFFARCCIPKAGWMLFAICNTKQFIRREVPLVAATTAKATGLTEPHQFIALAVQKIHRYFLILKR